jgi:hypothetical protein
VEKDLIANLQSPPRIVQSNAIAERHEIALGFNGPGNNH